MRLASLIQVKRAVNKIHIVFVQKRMEAAISADFVLVKIQRSKRRHSALGGLLLSR